MESVGAGDSVTTDPGNNGPSAQVPVTLSVTTPNAGTVTIQSATSPADADLQVVGAQLAIEAPAATASAPLVLELTVHASAIPAGVEADRLDVQRNGTSIPDCNPGPGDPTATPDPCVASRVVVGGDVTITIYTSGLSLWRIVVTGLGKTERACAVGMAARGVTVTKVQGKIAMQCMKKAAAGKESNAETCLTADSGGKLLAATARTSAFDATRCVPAPVFAYAGATAVNSAAQTEVLGLVHDLFGPNLTASVQALGSGAPARCQKSVLAEAQKRFAAATKAFLKCRKEGIRGTPSLFVSSAMVQTCFDRIGDGVNRAVANASYKLRRAIDRACAGVDSMAAFPGACSGGSLSSCLDAHINCRVCRFLNAQDGLAEDCDLFDDNTPNASCS